ncbi:MAG TPA: hypothetical protein VG838_00515 [Opitutaceae bacterium]|nr:hypothetical protein [Opitutaceae bacterium]
MSKLITATTKAGAQALADKAQAWLQANDQSYRAVKWDDPIQHPTIPNLWGIVFADYIAAAFTSTERGDTSQPDALGGTTTIWTKVVDATADWFPAPSSP